MRMEVLEWSFALVEKTCRMFLIPFCQMRDCNLGARNQNLPETECQCFALEFSRLLYIRNKFLLFRNYTVRGTLWWQHKSTNIPEKKGRMTDWSFLKYIVLITNHNLLKVFQSCSFMHSCKEHTAVKLVQDLPMPSPHTGETTGIENKFSSIHKVSFQVSALWTTESGCHPGPLPSGDTPSFASFELSLSTPLIIICSLCSGERSVFTEGHI